MVDAVNQEPTPTPESTPTPSAATPVTPTPSEPKTVVTPEPTPAPSEPKAYWPEDWQKRIAGDDDKVLKQISRYQSPEEIWKKARSLEQRLSSGELKPVLPKNAKPEEIVAWRKDNGIPEAPDKYDLGDIKVPETEAEAVSAFLKDAHGANFTTEQAKAAVGSYLAQREAAQHAVEQRDEEQRLSTIDALASEWGGKFSTYKNLVHNVLAKFPEAVREDFMSARLPDGTAIFNNPEIVKAFVSLELMNNPAGVTVGGSGGDLGKSMIDRYNEIQSIMRDDRQRYNKDDALQTEHRNIIDGLIKNGLMNEKGQLVRAA